jgi:hypothetical protein
MRVITDSQNSDGTQVPSAAGADGQPGYRIQNAAGAPPRKRRNAMAHPIHFHAAHQALAEDERVRAVARRAIGELGFPFDAIYLETAMALAQVELPAGLAKAGMALRPGK